MKLYHLSDLHIGVNSRLGVNGHKTEVMKHLRSVFETAERENVDFIVFAGDVFHSNAVPTSFVMEFFELLANFPKINFVVIPGGGSSHSGEVSGHDAYTSDTLYRRVDVASFIESAPNIFLLTPDNPAKKIDNTAFYAGFFDYPKAELIDSALYHVAVMHGAFGRNEEKGEKPVEPIADKYHYIALGHYHNFKRLIDNAAYSGAFVQFEFLPYTDAVSGYAIVELGEDNTTVRHCVLPEAPKFVKTKLKDESDVERVKNLLEDSAFVRITSYVKEYRDVVYELKKKYPNQLEVSEGAEVTKEDFGFLETLEDVLSEVVPEELSGDVKELLLYGLQVSSAKKDVERFLREHFGF